MMKTTRIFPENFPYLLNEIESKPKFLDYAGAPLPSMEEYKYLCVIGARKHTSYGKDACQKLIGGLKNYPVVIVSGLAIGIDSIAHTVALETGLKTVAIPGSGLSYSSIYPQKHLRLAQTIVDSGGTLLSPFEKDNPGGIWTFPVRNQLMAAISHATLIIEGGPGSGTLLTANHALEFNRDVMIVPGSIFSELSYGPHLLYREGAKPVFNSEDILEILGFDVNRDEAFPDRSNKTNQTIFDLSAQNLSDNEMKIINLLRNSPHDSTEISDILNITTPSINIAISQLEMRGLVSAEDGIFRIKSI